MNISVNDPRKGDKLLKKQWWPGDILQVVAAVILVMTLLAVAGVKIWVWINLGNAIAKF